MEIGREITRKLFYILFGLGVLFDIALIIVSICIFKNPLKESIDDIINLTKNEIYSLNTKIKTNCNKLIYKYMSDLKLIAGHGLLYQKGDQSNPFFKNYNTKKLVISANNYEYPNETHPNQYHKRFIGFKYIENLEKKFENIYNHNEIINTLFNEPEFDIIGYHTYSKKRNINEIEKKYSAYFISILKSIFMRRYIIKRNDIDYIRFIITQNNISFIYPYDRASNSMTISLFKKNISLTHVYNSDLCKNYKLPKDAKYNSFFTYFARDYIVFCLLNLNNDEISLPYESSSMCSEINTTNFLDSFFWKNQTNLELSIVYLNNSEIEPIYQENSYFYQEIKNTFKNSYFRNYTFDDKIKLFHLLYNRLFSKFKTSNFTDEFLDGLIEEYSTIKQIILNKIQEIEESYCKYFSDLEEQQTYTSFEITKTECYKNADSHKVRCRKDNAIVIIYAFSLEFKKLEPHYYIEVEGEKYVYPVFYSLSIIESNPKITQRRIFNMIDNKIIKFFFFFCFIQIILIIFIWIIMQIINNIFLSPICQINSGLKIFDKMMEESKDININKILKYENKILISNKEMKILNNISNNIKKMIILKFVMNNKNRKYLKNSRICNIILKMKESSSKEICMTMIAYQHFKQKSFSMAENEFNLILNNIIHKEKKLDFKNDNNSDLKDIIKRFNDITYLNDNSILKGVNETILPNINIKFQRQKIVYLHGMCLYNQGKELLQKPKKINPSNNINKFNNNNNNFINNNNIHSIFTKAIKDFKECRNINKLLGSNPIKEIFSLIMIAKCNIQLKEYKRAISSINDAFDLFFELEKIFKDTNNMSYNPCIMLFVLNTIFQTIMYTLVQIAYFTFKFHSCVYLIFKIFDTSPFIVKTIFYNCSYILQNIIGKTKLRKNAIIYENTKRLYSKIFTRLFIRYYSKDINELNKIKIKYDGLINKRLSTRLELTSNNKISLMDASEQKKSSTKFITSTISILNSNTSSKLINICVSEKILFQTNGVVLKDVLIDYIEECFYDNNDNDKFSYMQFSPNGKKNKFIRPKTKEIFIQKLKIDKNEFEENNNFTYNSNNIFNEFYNLLSDCIELGKSNNDDIVSNLNRFSNNDDNVILMFINSEDIRFNEKEDCQRIVYELNKNNFSLYMISYEDYIQPEKIKNIKSFMTGLFDAHFFQIKNFQQIKQIFMNFATKKSEEDIIDYNYENIDFFI